MKLEGYDCSDEMLEKLSSLMHEHINFVGKYSFKYDQTLNDGRIRPLFVVRMFQMIFLIRYIEKIRNAVKSTFLVFLNIHYRYFLYGCSVTPNLSSKLRIAL